MKKLILSIVLFISFCSFSQEVWEDLPINANCTSLVYDIEMRDGKIYQIYSQNVGGMDKLNIDVYNPITQTWDLFTAVPQAIYTKLKTEKIGNKIFIVGYDGINFYINYLNYSSSPMASTISIVTLPYAFSNVNNNWEFHTGKNADELYLLFTTGVINSDVHGLELIPAATPQTSSWGYSTEASSQNLALANLQIQSNNANVYFGVYSNVIRVTRFVKGNIAVMFAYNGTTGNVLSSGANWDNSGFVLTGNRNDFTSFYGKEDLYNLTTETEFVGTNTIDVDWLSGPITTGFNLDANYLAKESAASHSFIFSKFSDDGVGNPNDNLYVIRRDISSSGSWELIVSSILPTATNLELNSLNLSIDNNDHHLAASYALLGGFPDIKVSNNVPDLLSGADVPNNGLCAGQINEIYPNFEINDVDFDRITILSISSLFSQTTNLTIIPNGFINGTSKFKILGNPSALSDQIQVVYTDGYGIFTINLLAFSGNTLPTNVQFLNDPVIFCSNEMQIDLSEKVNYYDQGTFKLNGLDLNNTLIDAIDLNQINTNGVLRYLVNINGCFISTTANYQIVTPPTINVVSNPSNCSLANGDATATLIPGTGGNIDFYWSTGEITPSISNLVPGAYYAFAIDDNNCKATALASVESGDITVVENIVNPSCFNSKDGSISLTINGSSGFQFTWSTGNGALDLSNVSAGFYEFTLFDISGCEIKKSFELINPSKIVNSFTSLQPDCSSANGKIFSNASGGNAPLSYLWNTSATTVNLLNLQQGFYQLEITDANGCSLKDSLILNDNYATIITDSLILATCNINNGGINVTLTQAPLGGAINSILWDNGETSEDIYGLNPGGYMLTVNSGANCISQKTFILGTRAPLRNDICIVSVDTATITNLVIWEKQELDGISHYNIYRENDQAGIFSLIDTVQFSNLSVFNDVVASPLQRSWRYRIAPVNVCGVEGPLSVAHKTLHLNTINEVTPGIIDIFWDDYEGIASGDYVLYRFTDINGWETLSPTVPFGSPTQFTDTPPVGYTGLDYFVDFEIVNPCNATYRAQDFNRSRSNKDKGVFNPGQGTGDSNNEIITINEGLIKLTITPNPFQDELVFELSGSSFSEIFICDINGKELFSLNFNEGINVLDTKKLQSGMYFVKAKLDKQLKIFKIVK